MPPKKKATSPTSPTSKSDAEQAYDELAEKYDTLREHMDRRPSVSVNIGSLRCTYYLPPGHPLISQMEAKLTEAMQPKPEPKPIPASDDFEQWASAPAPVHTFESQLAEGFEPSAPSPGIDAVFPEPAFPPAAAPAPVLHAPTPAPAGDAYPLPCWKCGDTNLAARPSKNKFTGEDTVFFTCPNCPSETKQGFQLIVSAKDYWLKKKYAGKNCPVCNGLLTYREGKDGKPPFLGCANYKTRGCKFTLSVPLLVGPSNY